MILFLVTRRKYKNDLNIPKRYARSLFMFTLSLSRYPVDPLWFFFLSSFRLCARPPYVFVHNLDPFCCHFLSAQCGFFQFFFFGFGLQFQFVWSIESIMLAQIEHFILVFLFSLNAYVSVCIETLSPS